MMAATDGEVPKVKVVIKARPIAEEADPGPPPPYEPTEREEIAMYLLSLRAVLALPAPEPESYEGKARRLDQQNAMLLGLIEKRLKRMDVPFNLPPPPSV
jgi:hypothetical protein